MLAVGPGRWNLHADAHVPMGIEVGDRVIYARYGGADIEIDGETVKLLSESDVLAVLRR